MKLAQDRMMKLYRFLTGTDDADFCHKVSAAIAKGWELHGDPAYAFDPVLGAMRCGQAVVKVVDGKIYDPSMKLGEQ